MKIFAKIVIVEYLKITSSVIKHWRKTTQLAVWMKATNEHFTITNKYYILSINFVNLDLVNKIAKSKFNNVQIKVANSD